MTIKISRRGALDAAKQGGEAFRAGQEPSDNPYEGDDVGDRFMAHYWRKGYNRASDDS